MAKRTAKPKAGKPPKKAAQKPSVAAAASLPAKAADLAPLGDPRDLRAVHAVKVAIHGMSLTEIDAFESARASRDMIRHGQGVLGAILARRAELSA